MTVEIEYRCARCNTSSNTSFLYELCSDCRRIVDEEIEGLSYKVQQELVEKIKQSEGLSCFDSLLPEHALAIKKYGKQKEYKTYHCSWCGTLISEEQALSTSYSTSSASQDHRCDSCQYTYEERIRESKSKDDSDRRSLGL
jgi:DNA-directed RNA polymerase subunit RPC12/RpoP